MVPANSWGLVVGDDWAVTSRTPSPAAGWTDTRHKHMTVPKSMLSEQAIKELRHAMQGVDRRIETDFIGVRSPTCGCSCMYTSHRPVCRFLPSQWLHVLEDGNGVS